MESFNPFSNSISTTFPSKAFSKHAKVSNLFRNSILRQPPQNTPSKLPPTFNPFQNSIQVSQTPPTFNSSLISTISTTEIISTLQQHSSSTLPTIQPFSTPTPPTLVSMSASTLPSLRSSPISPRSTKRQNPFPMPPRSAKRQKLFSIPNPPLLHLQEFENPKTTEDTEATKAITFALGLLEVEFKLREKASQEFPPDITSSHIRTAISKYENEMSSALNKSICSCCGRIVATTDIYKIVDSDNIVLLLQYNLDHCGHNENFWNFCTFCYNALQRGNIPKFSSQNSVNVTMCQDYPSQLEDLTPVEECLIAKCHPVGTILKLRPGNRSAPTNYHALRGHMIVIPQDPGPLLQILPSPELKLDNLIKVFWLGKCKPTNQDLKPFLQVRKDKVLAALQYLVKNNHLYNDLTINYSMIESWPADFIPPEITNNIISLENPDHHKREGYTVSLEGGNYENDFHAAQDRAFLSNDHDPFVTGSIYTDVNGERVDPNIQMIDALLGVMSGNTCNADEADEESPATDDIPDRHQCRKRDIPMISYAIRGQATLMSSWENSCYFTGAFPTLFPTGLGGHLDQRPVPVSLTSFANWALNHHNRRFARHKTFMYLLYDVLQLRSSSLGNTLLVKRQDWKSTKEDIASLTPDQLQTAAKSIANGQQIDNPIIQRLQRALTTIGMQVPESFSQKLKMRSKIRGLIARYGMPAFWMTINPSDLRNPLVLILAGIECPEDILSSANAAIRHATATSNPVAVAQFFNHICKGIFKGLLRSHTGQIGILGEVSNHFGVVETNGRGMLHLHALIWLTGNVAFESLRHRLLQDSTFANRMIRYLEAIIVQSINIDSSPDIGPTNIPPSSTCQESDYEFYVKLSADSNSVACKNQIHSKNHNATCFKYRQKGLGKNFCRFGMPRNLHSHSEINELGVIHIARNHGWVNPWNPAIASCIRSNQDISWIPTVTKCLCLIYYLTNYATKDDVSPYQMLVKAALLKQSIEKAKATLTPNAEDLRIRKKNIDQFALRCFNSLSHDREISGVQIANSLLQLPTYYTENDNFVSVNLWWLRKYVRIAIESVELLSNNSSDAVGEEQCTFQPRSDFPLSRFDNYKWRGLDLARLSFFEYCMLVQTRNIYEATTSDMDFDSKHPKYGIYVQRLASTKCQVKTITFTGQLSEFQKEEESVQGGHPITAAIKNDFAEVLLGLFVPWDQLLRLFQQYATEYKTKQNAYAKIWNIVDPTLSQHNRNFAQNIQLLRKSKEDVQIDAALRASMTNSEDSVDYDIDDIEPTNLDFDIEVSQNSFPNAFSNESLITAYLSIARSSHQKGLMIGKRIPTLLSTKSPIQHLQLRNLLPLNIFQLPTYASSGLKFFPSSTLEHWQSYIKNISKLDESNNIETDEHIAFGIDDFDPDLNDGALYPTLSLEDNIATQADRRSQVGDNPSAASLTSIVTQDTPLNRKQRLVVEKVLSKALAWGDNAYDASKRDQMLLYIGGEGGVGKSQIIKAVVAGIDLILRKNEIILMAPTGAAADNIGGNTYHTLLGISISKPQKPSTKPRIKKLWSKKTIMIVDEISMTDLSMLNTINNQCKIAKSLDRNSPDLFGGLPIVIFMGDFYQFPPVRGPALWKEPREGNDEDVNGQMIWHQFTNVIILDQQMRQAQDPIFYDLLRRARTATLTEDDLALLNSKVPKSLLSPELENATTVAKLNALRHHINHIQMEHFACSRSQRIYIFPAQHNRTASTSSSPLRIEDLLQQTDQGSKIPFQGLFSYTPDMPVIILSNICTPLGHVNGARGFASGIVVDPTTEFFEIDDLYVLCTKPPACVLFKQNNQKCPTFAGLDSKIVPVFSREGSITIKGYSVRRKQVPMCPAFSLTDYKIQGSTLTTAVLDLKDNPSLKGQSSHKKFCSIYVQLSRLRSLDGLHLLQKIDMKDLQFRPDDALLTEMERLSKLEEETIAAWEREEKA